MRDSLESWLVSRKIRVLLYTPESNFLPIFVLVSKMDPLTLTISCRNQWAMQEVLLYLSNKKLDAKISFNNTTCFRIIGSTDLQLPSGTVTWRTKYNDSNQWKLFKYLIQTSIIHNILYKEREIISRVIVCLWNFWRSKREVKACEECQPRDYWQVQDWMRGPPLI